MRETPSDEHIVNLLWTGGWDSTFQLLSLLLIQQRKVLPVYLIDANRRSTGAELLAMKRIKEIILKEYPNTHELLFPTKLFMVSDIHADDEITEAFHATRAKKPMGTQYEWLSRFCKENGFEDMQLSIHLDDLAHSVVERFVFEDKSGTHPVHRIDPKFSDTKEYLIFGNFSFPIFSTSKTQMEVVANNEGWEKLMELTWFCHRPTRRMTPCGKCKPCTFTKDEGLGRRIPASRRWESYLRKNLLKPVKSTVKSMIAKLG